MPAKSVKNNLLITRGSKKGEIEIDYAKLRKVVLTLRSVNHPMRRRMLEMIEESGKMTVTSIYKKLRLEQSVVSQHLGLLRKAGVVKTSREGKFIYYSINENRVAEVTVLIDDLTRK